MSDKEKQLSGRSGKPKSLPGWQDDDVLFKVKDPAMAARIKRQMRAMLDVEEVLNDPELENTRKSAAKIISEYRGSETHNTEREKFISDGLAGRKTGNNAGSRIELGKSNINDISAEWVKEWHLKKQSQTVPSAADEERKNFIKSSLEADVSPEKPLQEKPVERKKGTLRFIRYTSLAAAAILGAFFLIKSLAPVSGDAIFTAYYKPYNAFGSGTRAASATGTDLFSGAVSNYKKGDYQAALSMFTEYFSQPANKEEIRSSFYLGLVNLALGNTDASMQELETAMHAGGLFSKDAEWYLGLACLKSGEKEKAVRCFDELSSEQGSYSEPARRILRRIK